MQIFLRLRFSSRYARTKFSELTQVNVTDTKETETVFLEISQDLFTSNGKDS